MTFTRIAALAGTTALSATAVFAQDDREGWPESFTVGTASQGGTFFVYGSGWAILVADELGISRRRRSHRRPDAEHGAGCTPAKCSSA